MKVYYHTGLRELAKCYGFRNATLKSLESCSNFKRTHLFLLQVWEALYREMVCAYSNYLNPANLINNVKRILESALNESRSPQQLIERLSAMLQDIDSFGDFKKFVYQMTERCSLEPVDQLCI